MAVSIAGDGTLTGVDPDASGFGRVLQVVQAVKTDTFSVSLAADASTSDITGLIVNITPSSSTSKILLVAQMSVSQSVQDNGAAASFFRDGSKLGYIGDAAGSRERVATSSSASNAFTVNPLIMFYLDSPATTSEVTYSIRMRTQTSGTQSIYLNRQPDDGDLSRRVRSASSITAIEVAA